MPRLRRPREADYPGIAAVVDDWWDGKVLQSLLPRLWFRHFAGTSWIAEIDDRHGSRRVVGFLVGYRSPDNPALGVIQAVGVAPNHRRNGLGRALVDAFMRDMRAAGAVRVETLTWPGNRRSVSFLAAIGFRPDPDADSRPIYGVPALEGYDFGTQDRARFTMGVQERGSDPAS
ncbi:MAG: GNAT family N-acetyltransferase [Chloroflexota bacterium]